MHKFLLIINHPHRQRELHRSYPLGDRRLSALITTAESIEFISARLVIRESRA